ncbi:MFS transporter [Streptomyces sp. NPDC051320]|uniref:MFS transporter n=1 Tax=Streptomyces sp. NPDC051320 TaxID=3154644 RepID=UPI00341516E5
MTESQLAVFRNRQFTALWSAFGISFLGDAAVRVGYPLLTLAVTGSPVAAGWVAFAANLPSLVLALPAGWAADTWNRRYILVTCQLVGTVVAAIVLAAVLTGSGVLPALIGGAFAEGTVATTAGAARLPSLRSVVPAGQRSAALSAYEVLTLATGLAGRALGGLLFGLARWLPFGANLASYLGSAALLGTIPADALTSRAVPQKPAPRHGTRESFRWLRQESFLRFCVLSLSGTGMVFQILQLVLIVTVRHSGDTWQVGLVLAASGAGGAVGAMIAPATPRSWSASAIIATSLYVWAALLAGMTSTTDAYLLALLNLGIGGVGGFSNVAINVYLLEAVPEEKLGRINAAAEILPNTTLVASAAAAGYLVAARGPTNTLYLLALAMITLAVCGTFYRRFERGEGSLGRGPKELSCKEIERKE